MADDFDTSDAITPPPMLFEPGRETHPQALAWSNREVEYVAEIATLKADKAKLVRERAQLILEVKRLRKLQQK